MPTRSTKAQADAKAADNARRVQAINDGEVLVFGPEGERRAHRLTCKRLPKAEPVQMTAAAAVAIDKATPASCCKPQLPKLSEAAMALTDPAPAPQASTNPAERYRLAKEEHAVLQAWIKDGERPPRPATPNLDAVNAEHAANGGRPRKARSASTKAPASGPYAEALAAKRAANNKRGAGTKVSADQLAAVASELRDQGLTQAQGLEVAYWLRKLAVSRRTWAKAWAASEAKAA